MADNALLGWRDGVLIAAGLAAVYLVVTLLRLLRIGRAGDAAKSGRPPPVTAAKPTTPAKVVAELSIDLSRDLPQSQALPAHREQPAVTHSDSTPAFSQELARSSVEAELQRLRRESSSLRDELTQVRDELSALKAARNVSPLYSEAMALAQRGITADGIAGQCGISLAEAELVAALARGETDNRTYPSDEDTHDGYPSNRTNANLAG